MPNYIKKRLIIAIPMLNLLFMHYFFYFNKFLEWTWLYSGLINLCSVIFDVFCVFFLSLIIVRGRLKPAVVITQFVTLIWSLINVVYGRFFFRYMPISALKEANGLGDNLVLRNILSGLNWYDLFYVVSVVCFFFLYRKTRKVQLIRTQIVRMLLIPSFALFLTLLIYSTYHFIHPRYRSNWDLYAFRVKELLFDSLRGGTPNLAHFQTGCLRVTAFEIYDMFKVTELTHQQKKEISDYYHDYKGRTSRHVCNTKIKNVIFILLESYLSAPIDLFVDGKEITPFLNSLMRKSDVYYNGNMKSDIGCGESGDGQFIYMTGILPLDYKMTIGQVKGHSLPALPIVLMNNLGIKHCEIVFPTLPNLWQQAEMNIVYGLNKAYSLEDIVGNKGTEIDDQRIFDFSSQLLSSAKEPFFSLILSISTHSPYDHYTGEDVLKDNDEFPQEYKNYLNTCHYTDCQLQNYFETLKQTGIYDRSLIIVASDHYAHLNRLKMNERISDATPLFIINGDIDTEKAWKGEFHQLDVYTTILDVLGINSEWKGLGRTLLSPNYSNSVTDKTRKISEMLIEGDYFSDVSPEEYK